MFKKYNKVFLDKEVSPSFSDIDHLDLISPKHSYPYTSDRPGQPLPYTPSTQELEKMENEILDTDLDRNQGNIEPETIIGEHVSMKGELSFKALIRIDGHFEGELISDGKLIIGPKGIVKANIKLNEAYIAGKVVGDITVKERLVLRGRAQIEGNIIAPHLSVDEGVSILGHVKVACGEKAIDEIDS